MATQRCTGAWGAVGAGRGLRNGYIRAAARQRRAGRHWGGSDGSVRAVTGRRDQVGPAAPGSHGRELAVGDPVRPVVGRALLAVTGFGVLVFAYVWLSKEIPALYVREPWREDPYDALISFMFWALPLLVAAAAVRRRLCRRRAPLPMRRVLDPAAAVPAADRRDGSHRRDRVARRAGGSGQLLLGRARRRLHRPAGCGHRRRCVGVRGCSGRRPWRCGCRIRRPNQTGWPTA